MFSLCNPAGLQVVYTSMKKKESRRIVPISIVTSTLVLLLAVFELLLIGGVLEIRAATVARIAPWACEPFLKLVGEHPDSGANKNKSKEAPEPASPSSAMDIISGFSADVLLAETNAVPDTTGIEAAAATNGSPAVEVPMVETNAPPKEIVPVG